MKWFPAYNLLVKVARGVFQRCVETTLDLRISRLHPKRGGKRAMSDHQVYRMLEGFREVQGFPDSPDSFPKKPGYPDTSVTKIPNIPRNITIIYFLRNPIIPKIPSYLPLCLEPPFRQMITWTKAGSFLYEAYVIPRSSDLPRPSSLGAKWFRYQGVNSPFFRV